MSLLGVCVLTFALIACDPDDDAPIGDPGPGTEPSVEELESPTPIDPDAPETEAEADAPETEGRELPFSRIQGVTTANDFGPFGDDGIERWRDEVPAIEDVEIGSSMDGHMQPALWLPPDAGDGNDGERGSPLLVVLHSWSTPYQQHLGIPFARWAEEHGWAMIHPNFRGVFETPEATGSDLAVQDVVDAVDFAIDEADIDEEHVFVVGFSGGGMMSLLVSARNPDRFAGTVSWVPVYDLIDWYRYNRNQAPEQAYAGQIEASCGGDPTQDDDAREECQHRSPSAHLDDAREAGLPVYIGHGLSDGIVPPDHAARAFNQLADGGDALGDDVVDAIRNNELVPRLDGEIEAETYFGDQDPEVFFSRESGSTTLVVFEGEHDMVYHPGLEWMTEIAAGR